MPLKTIRKMNKNVLRNNTSLIIVLILAVFAFNRCNKNSETIVNEENVSELSEADINKIGELHNEYLTDLFADFDWTNPTKEELFKQYNELDFVNSELKSTYSSSYLDSKCDFNENLSQLKDALSQEGYQLFEEALNLCYQMKSHDDFIREIELFKQKEELNALSVAEKNAILVACSVWKNSANYWMSPNENGSIILKNRNMSILKSTNLTRAESIVAADGTSAAIGMLGVAVAGALGPVGWVALAIVGGEAALSSGAAALF